ncbi:MAG: hypothetical protein JJ850_07910 [Kordiimonadaceae bacterium]|nr:hypothetical protein [Kordiimonadaceae bacterium]MBO6569052.1 hypothetical protein [Kordiimonadaceae bacterium]MBO6964527.1 hypothetical protein [Kordiimonadaceae bacterium]
MSRTSSGGVTPPIITFLKEEARLLQKRATAEEPNALRRLQVGSPAVALGADTQRKHALATIAREIGFPNWQSVVACFEGREGATFEAFLHPRRCHVFWNIWLASYDEAKTVRQEHGGYLLSYGKQFIVVDADYVTSLGIDPFDSRWERIGRDWHQPGDMDARSGLALDVAKQHMNAVQPEPAAA